jgi:hypothetical protein
MTYFKNFHAIIDYLEELLYKARQGWNKFLPRPNIQTEVVTPRVMRQELFGSHQNLIRNEDVLSGTCWWPKGRLKWGSDSQSCE